MEWKLRFRVSLLRVIISSAQNRVPIKHFIRKIFQLHHRTAIKNSKSKLIDYLTPDLRSKLAKCIDIKSITALQSNNRTEVEPGGSTTENGAIENGYDNRCDFHDADDGDDGNVYKTD